MGEGMNLDPLLAYIGSHESKGDYNAIVWLVDKRRHPPKKLTRMTIGEVLDWQDSIDRFQLSEAVGKYQIMEDTLRGLYRNAGLKATDLFNETNQDYLATQLLRRRGLTDYLMARISAEKFANALAHEWASLPLVSGPDKGKSVYAGDRAGNKAGGRVEAFLAAVRAIRESAPPEPPKRSIWTVILDLLSNLLGRRK